MRRAAIVLILSLLILGCRSKTPAEPVKPLALRLAYTTKHHSALVHLAAAKGYFQAEGVLLQPMLFEFGKQALAAVSEGKADLATVSETPFVLAALNGQRLSLVASIFTSWKNNGIVARGLASPRDLRGKRIAYTPGTTSEVFLDSFLMSLRIARQEVTLVALAPQQIPAALAAGEVDAASTWNPTLKEAATGLRGAGSVFFDPYLYTETFVLAGNRGYVDANRELMQRVLRALLKAEAYASKHPAEARTLMADAMKLTPELLAEFLDESRLRVSLDRSLLLSLEEESRWALRRKLAPEGAIPNYLEYIDVRPLQEVKPEAIEINIRR
uniref:NMT1/THI5 like domain protein n=1 Tax=Geobacter sp. (strain M21) TaxID=443144 RepID=C6DZG3_GEOSM